MTTIEEAGHVVGPAPGFFDRERIIAGPGFNRWLVPPAALAIHLCIGMAYGFSRVLAADDAPHAECALRRARRRASSPNCSRRRATGRCRPSRHIFEIFIAMLGISAAIWGGWLEHAGPRKAGLHRRIVLGRRARASRRSPSRSISSGWSISDAA